MNKALFLAMALVACGVAFLAADTTFQWSSGGQTGTLTYTGLGLASPTISGTVTDSATWTSTGTRTFSSGITVQGIYTAISTNGATTNTIITVDGVVDAAKVQGAYNDADGTMTISNITANGAVAVDSVDAATATTMTVGAATATKVEVADAGVETEVQGPLDVNGNADFDGTFTLSGSALNVTNGQAVTVSAGAYVLNGIGGANDTTNTITLAAPAAAGQLVYLAAATATTNLITIADSGTVAASGAILLDGNDTAVLFAVDTSTWCLISESDN